MRKITFIGSVHSISFASRYNKEVAPKLVFEGQQLRKFLGKNKNLNVGDLKDIEDVRSDLRSGGRANKLYKEIAVETNQAYSPGYNKKFTAEQSNGILPKEYRKQRIEQLKNEAYQRKNTQLTTTKGQKSYRPGTVKLLTKKRLAIGLGVAATGALAYGLARKIRSDKGKKRGRYFK